jgi:gas vesicle protein
VQKSTVVATQERIASDLEFEYKTLEKRVEDIETSVNDILNDTTTIHTQQTKDQLVKKLEKASEALKEIAKRAKDELLESGKEINSEASRKALAGTIDDLKKKVDTIDLTRGLPLASASDMDVYKDYLLVGTKSDSEITKVLNNKKEKELVATMKTMTKKEFETLIASADAIYARFDTIITAPEVPLKKDWRVANRNIVVRELLTHK